MPTKKDTKDVENNSTPLDHEDRPYRTGPNVDAGLEPGAVTVDPHTPAGAAAAAAREANGASVTTDDRVVVVDSVKDLSDDRMDDGRRVGIKAENDPKVTEPGR